MRLPLYSIRQGIARSPRVDSPQTSATHDENRANLISVAAKIIAARTDGGRFYFAQVSKSEREELRQSFNRLHNELNVSVLQIARMLGRTQSSVWQLFVALSVPRRGVSEASKMSAPLRTHHKRTPFVGSESDRAYMLGFASGDLTAWQVSGTSVMVSSTTTHPAFVELFHQMFDGHGPVYQYPMYEKGKGYRWKVATRLDNSFRFLLTPRMQGLEWATDGGVLTHWLAGITDSDGSIQISRASNGVRMKLNLYNTD